MSSQTLVLLLMLACAGVAAFLAGYEAGVFALSRWRIRQQMRAGRRRARILHEYLENPEDFLWTILIGNTLATLGFFSLLVIELHAVLRGSPWWFVLAFLPMVFVFYVFCDLLPKMLFRMYPNRLSMLLAIPFRVIRFWLTPLVALMRSGANVLLRLTGGRSLQGALFGSRSELRWVMQESATHLSSEERVLIDRVLDSQNATVRSIAVPIDRVVSVNQEMTVTQALELCREKGLNRFPVWERKGAGRRIVGVVSMRAVLYAEELSPEAKVGDLAKRAVYVKEGMRLEEAFRRLQRNHQRLAVVVGPDNRETGIVTMQDILKAIFGEVRL